MTEMPRWMLLCLLATAPGCVWVSLGGKTLSANADYDARISALEARIAILESQQASVVRPSESGLPAFPVPPE